MVDPRPPRRRGFVRALSLLLSAVLMVPAVIVSGLRLLRLEWGAGIVSAEAALPYLLLPAYLGLVVALIYRVKALGAVALVLAVAHGVWMSPPVLAHEGLSAQDRALPTVRVFSHNIKFDNDRPEDLGADIITANADLVFLQELTLKGQRAIEASGAFRAYPYSFKVGSGTDGLGLWSKTPLSETELVVSPGFPALRAVTTLQGTRVVVYDIHTRAPVNGDVRYWHLDLAQIKARLAAESGAVIAAGDFNATWQHRPFRALFTTGYREAAAADGRPYARTWPVTDRFGGAWVDGLIRLDHVLVSPGIVVRSTAELGGGGSDHRAITADLAFRSS